MTHRIQQFLCLIDSRIFQPERPTKEINDRSYSPARLRLPQLGNSCELAATGASAPALRSAHGRQYCLCFCLRATLSARPAPLSISSSDPILISAVQSEIVRDRSTGDTSRILRSLDGAAMGRHGGAMDGRPASSGGFVQLRQTIAVD